MKALRLPLLLVVPAVFILGREPNAVAAVSDEIPAAVLQTLETAGPTLQVAGKPVEIEAVRTFYQQRGEFNPSGSMGQERAREGGIAAGVPERSPRWARSRRLRSRALRPRSRQRRTARGGGIGVKRHPGSLCLDLRGGRALPTTFGAGSANRACQTRYRS